MPSSSGEQRGCISEPFLAGPGHLDVRRAGRSGAGGHFGEHLGDGAGRDELCAHLLDVAHVALRAPVDQLRHELVELGGAQHRGGDRPIEVGPLVGHLGGAVPGREPVGPDDRHHDDLSDTSALAVFLQVPGGRGEEGCCRLLLRFGSGGGVQ